jgi:hypothetical protein
MCQYNKLVARIETVHTFFEPNMPNMESAILIEERRAGQRVCTYVRIVRRRRAAGHKSG